jgi:hypothetical protein
VYPNRGRGFHLLFEGGHVLFYGVGAVFLIHGAFKKNFALIRWAIPSNNNYFR